MLQFKRLSILICFIAFCNLYAFAQFEGNSLLFTPNIIVDFNCGNPLLKKVPLIATCSANSACDSNGNILFYADQARIYNKNLQLMPGGINPYGNNTCLYDGTLVVPQPGYNNRYNLFYLNCADPIYCASGSTLNRILIDMSLNSGLGGIILQEFNILKLPKASSCLSGAMHLNKKDYWIITVIQDSLYSFLLNSTSFSHTSVRSCQPLIISSIRQKGVSYHKMSYDQKHIAFYYGYSPLPISVNDFDNNTGKIVGMKYFLPGITNQIGFTFICISPSGRYLYFAYDSGVGSSRSKNIIQYDISLNTTADIEASAVKIGNINSPMIGDMIITPDNKIYCLKNSNYLGIINSPDKKGIACNYIDSGFYCVSGFNSIWTPNFLTRKPYLSRFNFSGICSNQPTNFSLAIDKASTFFEWNFDDPGSGVLNSSIMSEPTHIYKNPGRYKVQLITNKNLVKDTSAKYVCIEKGPINPLLNDTILCKPYILNLSAGNDGFHYLWSTGDTIQSITVKDTGIYILIVKNNSCSISDTIRILPGFYLKSIFDINDTFICRGNSIKIDTKLKGYKFSWSTGDTTSYIIISDSGRYLVKVLNGNCTMTDSVLIGIKNKPIINLGNDTAICSGENIILDANYKNVTYKWSTGETSRTILIHNKGIYSVIVNKDTCATYDSIYINVYPLPYVNLGNDTAICEDDPQTILLDAGNATYYQWFPSNENTPKIIVTKTGTYTVIITDSKGCISSDSINIEDNCKNPIFIPNAFSPNNDGINDFFLVSGIHFISLEMIIFDRWGEQIFKSNVPEKGWDGTFKNTLCPQGVYLYIISVHTKEIKKTFSGPVTLIR